jgi:hypothetical protein
VAEPQALSLEPERELSRQTFPDAEARVVQEQRLALRLREPRPLAVEFEQSPVHRSRDEPARLCPVRAAARRRSLARAEVSGA